MLCFYLIDGSYIAFLPCHWPQGGEFHALAEILFPDDEVEFQSFDPRCN